MSLLHFNFGLPFLSVVKFRASALNANGWGETSDPNTVGAQILTAPLFMSPAQRASTSSDTQIDVFWTPLTDINQTGGSSIQSYGLEWDSGTS
jgi:hypothetical protein